MRADTLLLDLEDSVAPDEKDRARELVVATLQKGDFNGIEVAVRINPSDSDHFDADLEAVVAAGADAVMLPKSQSSDVLREVGERVGALERKFSSRPTDSVRILALVETPVGIVRAAEIAGASARVDAMCFGHADFAREMGLAEADASAGVIHHARCEIAIAAVAAGVAPIDCVFLDVRDEAGFRSDVEHGMALGFEGKLCIHPAQVEIANDVYTPTAERVARARRVVDAWENALAEGSGVFSLDGKMIDAPLVAIEERVLDRARRAGRLDGTPGQ
jgi:citrate lyase subunit beta/citryl-CoA lyase